MYGREGERRARPAANATSDEALTRRVAAAGDHGALSALYDRYAGMVYAMGLRLLGDRSLAEILAPSETTAASLSPTGIAPEASGEVRLEGSGADNARVRLEVSGLPEPRPDEYYELWFVRGDGQRISGGGFTVDREGRATVSLNAPRAARGYPGVGITLEESPGDPRPSPDKVLGGELRGT